MDAKIAHGVRSYDFEGRCFSWEPPSGLRYSTAAIDVERKDTRVSTVLQRRFRLPPHAFLKRWTATEAVAKVIDRPILAFVREQGLLNTGERCWSHLGDVWYRTVTDRERWISVAIRPVGDTSHIGDIAEPGTITEFVPRAEKPNGTARPDLEG
jgi:hypothetical protein